ncbi:TetR family transcriptional regulator [Caballeronia sp. LZ062]|uniref:TetR family transcriptional regulator n=1 Tax=unclassified Caballeronia TaxID=2646786 RepID=UPI002865EED7|nr:MULTISPECIES: TetR family transcriptional regulator [unclassified Caballeronia]MDR5856044.1 TetR family transcriptional regulator [Caballeronia sp. LZ050]MDR5872715.1 TetR family transcriptional regulator [Caballeronia sp. LZ062]
MDTNPSKPVKRDPEATRRRILEAATDQFSRFGLAGARVDAISEVAGSNERMLYYYFGSKELLYVAVLESMYKDFARKESSLDLTGLAPRDAIATLAQSIWTYFWDSPQWLSLINNENLHQGRYLKASDKLNDAISPLVEVIQSILERGADAGQFRRGVDPLDFYLTLIGMGYYIASNRYTIDAFTGRDYVQLADRQRIAAMHAEMLLAFLRPPTIDQAG